MLYSNYYTAERMRIETVILIAGILCTFDCTIATKDCKYSREATVHVV